jgi:hypothetical protein
MNFSIDAAEFRNALELLLSTSSNSHVTDSLDLIAEHSKLTLQITGSWYEVTIDTVQGGGLRIPLRMVERVSRMLETYGQGSINVSGGNGYLKVGDPTITSTAIICRETVRRKIDIPEDASALDVLALTELFTRVEIEESALTKRLRMEQEHLAERLAAAASSLSDFGVSHQELLSLVKAHIRDHAPKIRKALADV